MTASGRSRNTPCFCGSGQKLKLCCGRSLHAVRTWKAAEGSCRWRFWAPHSRHGRHASQVAEHICNGQRIWIARGTPAATSWLIDEQPATLMEILDHVHGAHYHWVLEQTMAALNNAAPDPDEKTAPAPDDNPDNTRVPGEIYELMREVLRLAHASDALQAHLPVKASDPANQPTCHHTTAPGTRSRPDLSVTPTSRAEPTP